MAGGSGVVAIVTNRTRNKRPKRPGMGGLFMAAGATPGYCKPSFFKMKMTLSSRIALVKGLTT